MKIVNLILPIMSLLAMILGCGGTNSATKTWQKAKPLTENLDHPKALANDGKFIYFVTGGTVASQHEGTNNVMKMPIAGGAAPTILFKGGEIIPDAFAVALDENYVYFSANGLRRVPKNGGDVTLLTETFTASEIVADKENVYWMPYVGEGMPPAPIYAISKNGGTAKTLTDARKTANGLCIDDKFVYWIQTDGIYKIGKQGGNIEKIYSLPPDGEIASDLKTDADNFYFLQVKSKNLMKLAKSGGATERLAKNASKFWLGENEIVFERPGGFSETAIFKVPKNGGAEVELDKGNYLADLTVGENKIYLSDIAQIFELEK